MAYFLIENLNQLEIPVVMECFFGFFAGHVRLHDLKVDLKRPNDPLLVIKASMSFQANDGDDGFAHNASLIWFAFSFPTPGTSSSSTPSSHPIGTLP